MRRERRDRWWVALAAMVAVAVTSALGLWQLQRGAAKQALADAMRVRAELPALSELPPAGSAEAPSQWHRRIVLRGHWMAAHTIYLDNRQINEQGRARVGFDVLTPLKLADGTAVVVQRGWVPRDFTDRARLMPVHTPEVEVEVRGRYAPPPPRLYEFKSDSQPLGRVRQNLELDAFAGEIGVVLRPGSVVQLEDDAVKAGVVQAQSMPALKRTWALPDAGVAKHHGYAFQWFGLSALFAGLYVWFQIIRPRRTRTDDA